MKTIRTFIKIAIASLFCILTMASCSELSLSETKLKFSEYNEMKSFIVRTDLNWWMAEQPEWVSIAKIEENGKTIVEVTPEKNHSLESRKGKIKIQTAEKFYIVDVFQDGVHNTEFTLSETKLNFSADDETKFFDVRTDLNWWMAEQPEWVSIAEIEKNGKTIVEVTPKKNHSFNSRKDAIKFKTVVEDYTIEIFQDGVKLKKESGDLGLSVEWSTCNLGAMKSTDFGNYYTWNAIHDYQSNGYRLPTYKEQRELILNCNWVWGENNGAKGCYFVAKNGNYVFLPAAGDRYGTDVDYVGSCGYYWSSAAHVNDGYGKYLYFSSSGVGTNDFCRSRYDGHSVRLVRGKE